MLKSTIRAILIRKNNRINSSRIYQILPFEYNIFIFAFLNQKCIKSNKFKKHRYLKRFRLAGGFSQKRTYVSRICSCVGERGEQGALPRSPQLPCVCVCVCSTSDDETIGAEAEKEFEEAVVEEPVIEEKTKPKRVKLTNGQRLKLIDAYRQGKTDKFYNVIPDKKKPGDFRIVKRRKPLNVPIVDNEPINMDIEPTQPLRTQSVPEIPIKEDKGEKNKINMEFYTMQNTINNSLSKEIAAVMEKCNKIERKLKEQKRADKEKRSKKQEQEIIEYEMDEEEIQPLPPVEEYCPEPAFFSPFSVRRRIDLRNF